MVNVGTLQKTANSQSHCTNDKVVLRKNRCVQDLLFLLLGNAIFLKIKFSCSRSQQELTVDFSVPEFHPADLASCCAALVNTRPLS